MRAAPSRVQAPWRQRVTDVRVVGARVLLGALLLVGLFCSLAPQGRAFTRAALLLPALVGQSDGPPLTLVGDTVRHTQLSVPSRGGDVLLDVYAPLGAAPGVPGAREGVILIPGVGDNRAEPQLVNLATALARAGLVAMAMTTPTLIRYALTPDDGDAVVQAFQALARQPGVGRERIGILGFSAGGALACLAAADPRIRDQVAFITLFGGYFDASSLLRDIARRALIVDGQRHAWTPNPVPVQVLANTISDTLPTAEATTLTDAFAVGAPPLDDGQLAQLSPGARAAYHLLAGDAPDQADANLAALSPAMRQLLSALSPMTVLPQVRTPIYLLHDQADVYVPFTESRAFAAALTARRHPHEYAEFSIFAHVEIRSGLGLGPLLHDGASLLRILTALLLPAS